jgi:hypothetical protein
MIGKNECFQSIPTHSPKSLPWHLQQTAHSSPTLSILDSPSQPTHSSWPQTLHLKSTSNLFPGHIACLHSVHSRISSANVFEKSPMSTKRFINAGRQMLHRWCWQSSHICGSRICGQSSQVCAPKFSGRGQSSQIDVPRPCGLLNPLTGDWHARCVLALVVFSTPEREGM